MELLKDKVFNGISFEIIREEYREGYNTPFWLFLRITNRTDHKKKIGVRLNYISVKHGLKTFGNEEYFAQSYGLRMEEKWAESRDQLQNIIGKIQSLKRFGRWLKACQGLLVLEKYLWNEVFLINIKR